ncbi:MAG: signal peptidase I [Pirellulaceae bacterium]|jgi:signal peptidase I|nr:signal peptidase I [Pirellulaceae bacterium]
MISKTKPSSIAPRVPQAVAPQHPPLPPGHATRETVESIALAVILAFLFRAFVAEAFVIPTGSMAPTLMGQHKDVRCPECGYWYQAGASIEDDETLAQRYQETGRIPPKSAVIATTCPLCRYRQTLDPPSHANERTFSGDRILVSKFVYDFTSPQRWDVIVFKYPFNAKQNFIKRLVGLPNEDILIRLGDVFVRGPGQEHYEIARKPDGKLQAMLQVVDDSRHIATRLTEIGWPLRWQAWAAGGQDATAAWSTADQGHTYSTDGVTQQDVWLRYHHRVPSAEDWQAIEQGQTPPGLSAPHGELITDFYAYNAFTSVDGPLPESYDPQRKPESYRGYKFGSDREDAARPLGLHWVSDLALEGDVEVRGDTGELLLMLVKGGVSHVCRIDIASGVATLSIDDGQAGFAGSDGTTAIRTSGPTALRGRGTYQVCFSNVDAELRLWVDQQRVVFDGPTTYVPRERMRPVTSPTDPGDLAPAGIGSRGAALHLQRLRLLRDVYYVATEGSSPHEYQIAFIDSERIREILSDPAVWPDTPLFDAQAEYEVAMKSDELFPLGDNSPQSSDARMWPRHYVHRDLLIGKALLIYWPHPWYRPIPYWPNFQRMRLIH